MKKEEWWQKSTDGTAAEVQKEIAVNIAKWIGWRVFWILCLIVVL